jgi:enoyl-[acyl-carrier protein] reductase II
MYPEILDEHIQKCKNATTEPFGVNLPLLYPNIEEHIQTIIKHKVPIVFTSAGNPSTWTKTLQNEGIKVVHVVSSVKFAQKAEAAGVDAIVAEGFEAGGHNGRDETTTLCLIPMVRKAVKLPILAAGGIASGAAMLAVMNLGADGVQIGSRFAASLESSAHQNFKEAVIAAEEGSTLLTLKELTPVRLLKNPFFDQVQAAYAAGSSTEELKNLLGRGRAKKGMFEGDLIEGELEIGQIAGSFEEILSAEQIIQEIVAQYNHTLTQQQAL